MHTAVRLLLIAGLCVCTAGLTATLFGRRRSNVEGAQVVATQPRGGTRIANAHEALPAGAQDASSDVIDHCAMNLHSVEIAVQGTEVTISTGADLYESNPHRMFIWSLEILGANKKVVLPEQYYHHQIFKLPGGNEMRPTFSELVTLAPGTYTARVRLYIFEGRVPDFAIGEKPSGKVPVMSSAAKVVVGD